jgi:hypothetical protein
MRMEYLPISGQNIELKCPEIGEKCIFEALKMAILGSF